MIVNAHLLNLDCIFSGITNYPIGVGINAAGEVTIADNHNNFNLSVFSQDGVLISALESKVLILILLIVPAVKPHMSVNDIVQELLGGGLIMLLF